MNIGDRVSWWGSVCFGTRRVRCYGRIVSTNCGIPYYYNPPRYNRDGIALVAGRYPACRVEPEGRQMLVHEAQLIIRTDDLQREPEWSPYA